MKKLNPNYSVAFDNKSYNWFVMDVKSDKYKFYGRILNCKNVNDWLEEKEKLKVVDDCLDEKKVNKLKLIL
jgi:hypothetical protein